MSEEFNPTQFAIESLIAAGAHEQAATLALKMTKQAAKAAPAETESTSPEPEVRTNAAGKTYVPFEAMVAMTVHDAAQLRKTQPALYWRSVEEVGKTR